MVTKAKWWSSSPAAAAATSASKIFVRVLYIHPVHVTNRSELVSHPDCCFSVTLHCYMCQFATRVCVLGQTETCGNPGQANILQPLKQIFFRNRVNIYSVGMGETNFLNICKFSSYVKCHMWKPELTGTIKSKAVPLHTMQAPGGRGIAPTHSWPRH
jgi:hypothetical protein